MLWSHAELAILFLLLVEELTTLEQWLLEAASLLGKPIIKQSSKLLRSSKQTLLNAWVLLLLDNWLWLVWEKLSKEILDSLVLLE